MQYHLTQLWQQQQQRLELVAVVALLSFPYLSWHLLKLHWNWEDNADCSLSVSFFSENEHLHVIAVLVVVAIAVGAASFYFAPTLFVYFSLFALAATTLCGVRAARANAVMPAITSSMLTHRHTHTHTYRKDAESGRERERGSTTLIRTGEHLSNAHKGSRSNNKTRF